MTETAPPDKGDKDAANAKDETPSRGHVSLAELYQFASATEYLILFIGFLAAFGTGVSQPVSVLKLCSGPLTAPTDSCKPLTTTWSGADLR